MGTTDRPEQDDRFDTFTVRARNVLALAQEEAARFNHNYIGTEHLLLGLVREGGGIAARVLAELGVETNRVRSAVEFIIGRGDRMIVGAIGLTPRAQKVIELAIDEARRLGQDYVGTEHLLLGLVREGEGIAAGVLESLGVNLEKVRAWTVEVLSALGPVAAMDDEADAPTVDATLHPLPGAPTPAEVRNPPGSAPVTRFAKFTEGARKVLTLAQQEAARRGQDYIGTEHLLLGLVQEGEGVAAKVLADLGVDLQGLRAEAEAGVERSDHPAGDGIGLTPRAKKVIELTVDEARRLGHHYVGTEHLLLGLVREGEGVAGSILEGFGVTLGKARAQTVQTLAEIGAPAPVGGEPVAPESGADAAPRKAWWGRRDQTPGRELFDQFDKFTDRARKVLTLAQEEATRFNHNYIGTEHLLLGLVREGEGVAARALANLGVELNRVRAAVEQIIGRGDRPIVGEIGLTSRAKEVIELAVDEARRLGHHYVGTEHLLLGLVREGEGVAAGALESLGVDLEKVRTGTIRVLSQSSGPHGGTAQTLSQSQGGATPEWRTAPAGGSVFPLWGSDAIAERVSRLLRERRWAYLILHVAYAGPGGAGVVRGLEGGGTEGRFGRDTTPLHGALAALGAEGWELVAVDTAPKGAGDADAHYILKRPL